MQLRALYWVLALVAAPTINAGCGGSGGGGDLSSPGAEGGASNAGTGGGVASGGSGGGHGGSAATGGDAGVDSSGVDSSGVGGAPVDGGGGFAGSGGAAGAGGAGCVRATPIVCGRAGDNTTSPIECYAGDGTGLFSAAWNGASTMSSGWNDITNYLTITLADVTGDGGDDICARGNDHVVCYVNSGEDFTAPHTAWTGSFADADGWNIESRWGTLQFPDVNGDGRADVCARGAGGVQCGLSNGVNGFADATNWGTDWGDADPGWDDGAEWWGTLQFPDLDGDGSDDICGRAATGDEDGVVCALSNSEDGFGNASVWVDNLHEATGWDTPDHWATIQFPDVNGDGRADVCGRGTASTWCALSSGTTFSDLAPWIGAFGDSDEAGDWDGHVDRWGTIAFPDVDGDGNADVCGRGSEGIQCALSNGLDAFVSATLWSSSFSDTEGWTEESRWSTVQFPDVNVDGRSDVCGRGASGIVCALSNGEDGFGAEFTAVNEYGDGPPFDWSANPSNYRTIQFGWVVPGDCDRRDAGYALPWRTGALPPRY